MSSQRTWERRALAGLLEHGKTEGLDLVEGLSVKEDGTYVFMHEDLTESEAARVKRSVEALNTRLEGLFARLGGGSARADEEDGTEAEDDESGIVAGGGAFDQVLADPEPAAAGNSLPEAAGLAADDPEEDESDTGAAVLSDAESMPSEAEEASYRREPVGAGV